MQSSWFEYLVWRVQSIAGYVMSVYLLKKVVYAHQGWIYLFKQTNSKNSNIVNFIDVSTDIFDYQFNASLPK